MDYIIFYTVGILTIIFVCVKFLRNHKKAKCPIKLTAQIDPELMSRIKTDLERLKCNLHSSEDALKSFGEAIKKSSVSFRHSFKAIQKFNKKRGIR